MASFTFTTTRKSIPTFYVKEMNLSGVVVRENLTVRKVYLSSKLRISQNVSAKLSWIKKQLKKSKKNLKKQLHELSEYYIIFSSLKKRTRNEGL